MDDLHSPVTAGASPPSEASPARHIQITVPLSDAGSPRVIVVIASDMATESAAVGGKNVASLANHGVDDLLRLALRPSLDALSSAISDLVRKQVLAMQVSSKSDHEALHSAHDVSAAEVDRTQPIPGRSEFSKRELEVLRYLVDGCSNKVIARHMDIAETTVKIYVRRILSKTQSANRTQAVLWAIDQMDKGKQVGPELNADGDSGS